MKRTICIISAVLCLCMLFTACTGTPPADGIYTVDCTLTGGSGRASIEAAQVELRDGNVAATITWSSPFYDFMIVDGVRYEPIQESGNAVFCIPAALDTEIPVSADTVAMSQPHLIEYTLFFDSGSLREK